MDQTAPNIGPSNESRPSQGEATKPPAAESSEFSANNPTGSTEKEPDSQAAAPQERDSYSGETGNQNSGMPLPQVVSTPVQQDTGDASAVQPIAKNNDDSSSATPSVADDVDVVEKEWVDRARVIVDQTRDDPYRQEQEVEKLQMDYLKKRYGKEIKSTDTA